jgi:hypothetical protein
MSKRNRNNSPSSNGSKSGFEILIAKYGLAGVVISAIFGSISLIIVAIIGYLGTQTQVFVPINATQTAEAKLSSVPTLTPIPSSTITPILPTFTPAFTSTLEPSSTDFPSDTPSPVPTIAPTFTPTIEPKVLRGFDKNCISKSYWNPTPVFTGEKLTLDKNNCWNLSSWGIVAENQTLKFVITDDIFNQRVTRSIFTTIGNNTIIQFKVRVDTLTSASDMDGVLFIGLGNRTSYSEPGYYLQYIVPAGKTKSYFEFGPTYFSYWEPRIEYSLGDTQSVKIIINGSDVSIQIDDVELAHTTLLTSKREVLWIGYSTPAINNYVTATISEFKIYDK